MVENKWEHDEVDEGRCIGIERICRTPWSVVSNAAGEWCLVPASPYMPMMWISCCAA